MDWGFITVLVLGIATVALALGAFSLRRTQETERGSLPGKGEHVIEVDYNSGAGGGSQIARFTIPRDPQDYAKRFVPRDQRTPDKANENQRNQTETKR